MESGDSIENNEPMEVANPEIQQSIERDVSETVESTISAGDVSVSANHSNASNLPEPTQSCSVSCSTIDTHLESNIHVIENQNNENLERDSERIGTTNPETKELESSGSRTDGCEPTDHLSSVNEEKSQNIDSYFEIANETSTEKPNKVCDSDVCQTENSENSIPDSGATDAEEFRNIDNPKDQKWEAENDEVKTNNATSDAEAVLDECISDKCQDEFRNANNSNTSKSPKSHKDIDNNENAKVVENLDDIALTESEIYQDKVGEDMDYSSNEIFDSSNTLLEKDTNDTAADKSTDTSSEAEKDKDSVDVDSRTADTSIVDINGENIEFAQVDFDANETDKEIDDKDGSTSKDLETDPIASDVFEAVDEREGADEELCIIPDTEREISQAEKDAASSIPPLKDISEASVSSLDEPLAVDSSEVRVYKYDKDDLQSCRECMLKRKVKYYYSEEEKLEYICDSNCLDVFKQNSPDKNIVTFEETGSLRVKKFDAAGKEPPSLTFIRKCAMCKKVTDDIEVNLTWEIMDFCNEFCLSKYQRQIGSRCSSCSGDVKSASLGKYCVRFGNDIRQFCTSTCLEQYKKGLKVCSYCQQDMSNGPEGFLAPVGEKGQFKDFCSKVCMEKYDIMTNDRPPQVDSGTLCSVCKTEKPITIEFDLDGSMNYFCGEPCFVAFSFVNNISPGKCAMCRRHFNKSILEQHTMYYDNIQHSFCSNSCENIYIIAHRKIVPCSWCKVKKYNFDMIKKYSKNSPVINMCSINCLSLYQVSLNAVNSKRITCNYCLKSAHPMYHLTMSDATIRNFCSYNCVMSFQNQFPKQPITLNTLGDSGFPVPTGAPKKNKKCPQSVETTTSSVNDTQMPVISNVQSLANSNGSLSPTGSTAMPPGLAPISSSRLTRSKAANNSSSPGPQSFTDMPVQIQVKQHYVVRPAPCPEQRNVATMCSVRKNTKNIQCRPTMVDAEVQTDKEEVSKILIPIPVPIYVPSPCHMYTAPVPVPVPFPLPIPIPIFIPTTRNSAAGIMKEIKKIQVKIPTDPYEAELLMMAEMVAEEKKEENTDSESDLDDNTGDGGDYSPEPVDASNTFGDDMLQMALKMATELDEPAVDLEGALTANTITAPQGGHPEPQDENVDDPQPMLPHMMERSPIRGRKRGIRGTPRGQAKRGRRMSHHQVDMPMMQHVQQPPPPPEPQEKPDANMCLKYTFGVNAWKQWVTTKNAELEKSSRRVKLFKTEILQLTADELNYSLCLFVKEVRKPNGQEYAPDTIYYLCLGIQQYLFENGRIDNIFCDPYYEKFTDCLDEVAKKFSVLYNDSHYIVTRVEEEHLWESKQLGAHSPHVLLSTLMFFNTKHFNLTSVDEHMQLSFSHIMKHWKRNPNQPGASKVPGSRNVLLRFYPPQSAIQNNQRKKKVYEQQENEENPLRCPVKLYEFYLSKCPESVKTRNDVFYLQPERSCVPDSPVWYSTMPLPKEALEKMLHRVKMVKEINVALLTS